MKFQTGWILVILCVWLFAEVVISGPDSLDKVGDRYPDKEETEVCGTIRDVIQRDSGRFRRILIRNTNSLAYYSDDDARRMTSRTTSKFDVLASLVEDDWDDTKLRVVQAWTDQVVASDPTSLHYEGRSVRLQTSDNDEKKLGRLAGLAILAGFDWVEYTNENYIRASVIPDVCQTSVDLVFVLDGSGSVGEDNFNKVLDFAKRVIDFFNIGEDGTHVAVVTYETRTNIEFNLVEHFTKNDLRNAVDDIEYQGFLTYTGEALNTVREKIFTEAAGMRADVGIPKVLLLLTDGHSNGIDVLEPSNKLRDLGVNIFSIGVGPSVSQSELRSIASDPDSDYVFTLNSFNQLASFVDRVSSVSCSEGSLINFCKDAVTSVESGSFKYFRTVFDVVTNDKISVEIRDREGTSHLYASSSSKNPGPLDSGSVKNEEDTKVKAVLVTLDESKTVYVAVQGQKDVNEFRLSFWDNLFEKSGSFQVDVEENQSAGELITLDIVTHSYSLKYSITDGNTTFFSIETNTPKISTLEELDYEATQQYNLVIVADDNNNVCHRSRASVQINVIDVNDNVPKFANNQYTATVAENVQNGAFVKKVEATDLDSGENGRLTYSITDSTSPGLFEIDSSNGDVTLNGKLDFETESSYMLTITAQDNGSPSLKATAVLKIFVTDVNEQPKISCVGSCIYSISEDVKIGTTVGSLSIHDPDKASNCVLQYKMPQAAAEKFTISQENITTIAMLDREDHSQYVFYITVHDCDSPALTDSVRVSITVGDVNDNTPQFPGSYSVYILESESIGSTVVQVKATDADEGANAEIKYTFDQNGASVFTIDENDGTVKTSSKLDYEDKISYTFIVTAQDQGPGSNRGQTQVTVNIIDVNDNVPSFVGTPYVANVKENVALGTPVIDVNATDSDSGRGGDLKYSIISGNVGPGFTIDEDTGLITVNSGLDQETTPSYTLVVQAKDQGSPSLHSETTVTITVGDTNDNRPVFQGLPYTTSVPEDFGTSQPILTVFATDDDAGTFGAITYSIESPSIAKDTFNIDNDGKIRVSNSLDYETKKDYVFTIVARDGGNQTTQATVSIYVSDINDHEPRFEKNPYNETVAENLNAGYVVGTVKATDEDSGQRGSVTYSIISGNTGNAFTINADGEVIALIRLDRETQEFYTLTIEAKDGGSIPKSSTTNVEITVLDENDNPPVFDKDFYSFMTKENNNLTAEVGQFGPATDSDKNANGEVVYTLSGDHSGTFEYDPSGKLIAKKVLDRETTPVYNLVLKAKDKGSPSLSATVRVQVIVLDGNDNGPVFSESPYNCTIDENSATNSRVCFIYASDADAGPNAVVTYDLVTPSSTFSVDENNGEIKALVTLDREQTPFHTFDIIATDGGTSPITSTVTVNVRVLDKNDNEPKFNQSSYSFDVSEDAKLDTEVGSVFAEDKDEGLSGEVVYSITSGNTGLAFSIDSSSGLITVKSSLDRETIASYKLTVQAADRGKPSQFSSREVIVTVTDVNDHDPIFTADPYFGNIAEDASVGSPVVQAKANDADEGINSKITYNITAGDNKDHFTIDADSGFINTATKLDFESKKSYLLTVTAIDGGNPARLDTAVVNITIENANDNAPTFEPGSPLVRISEAVAIGTNVVKFNATDKDGNSLTFSLTSGNTGDTFSIDKDTGVLTTNATLDRETVPRYNLTVTVTDRANGGGGQSSSRDLIVIVTDENDNAPRFVPKSYSVNVTENTGAGLVETVSATDDDEDENAEITFSIDPTSAQKFNIDSKSGEISTKSPLDYEDSSRYVITVTAKDAGTPSLSSTAEVVVTVEDLNDNTPDFKRDYATSLRENTAEGTVIRVEASDPDPGVNGEVIYNITDGNDEGFFTIGELDGIIKVANPPDREKNPSFTLTITARNKVPAHSSATQTNTTTTVTITIGDVNDNAPIITNIVTSVEVQENSPSGTQVLDVDAVDDDDIGVNSEIEFAIVDGNIGDAFVINTTSGLITVQGDIDRETREDYTLKVRVSDKGNPRLSSEKEFLVNVTDLDDNSPVFTAEPYEASVSEAANISTFVIQVEASDADIGSNGAIKFSIVSGDDQKRFEIDSESGEIVTNGSLDFETVPTYTLVVRAEDPSHSIQTNVQIRVVNINDNSPVFNPAFYVESIPENRTQNPEFVTLTATDKDEFGGLTYTIVSGNIDSRFTLEPGSGKLRVASELDRESIEVYNLTVRVTDGGAPARSDTAFVQIRITDINDNAPRFNTTRKEVKVTENSPVGTPVLTVFAEDSDVGLNGDVRYEITSGNTDGLFELGKSSGQLTVLGRIDRETIPNFRLEIVAKDQGSPQLTSSPLVVNIEVRDANDNSPMFTRVSYAQNISETSSIGSFVEEVQAIDADIGLNGEVVYSLFSGSEFFKIDNGVISTNVSLDRESTPSFTIIIIAKDLGNPPLTSTTVLTVTVLDANDNAPQFNLPLRATVTEEQPGGQHVTQVSAKDADNGLNAKVEYKLDSNAQQFLNIDNETGIVTTKVVFDFEAQRSHTFNVIASDKGNPSLSTIASLDITVVDTDDNCPVFNPKEYTMTIPENGPLGMTIVTVYATDVDTVGDRRLEYGIRKGNTGNTFRMERYTGNITSLNVVDREVAKEFNMIVRAGNELCGVNITGDEDELIEERLSKSIATVKIFVTDLNDNAPKFPEDAYKYELKDINVEDLLWVNATDPDEGKNAEFEFGLAGVTREGSKRTLTVTATDKGTPQQTSNTTVDVIGENCEAMTFSVSPHGHVSVKTLCKFDVPPSADGEDLVGEKVTFNCMAVGNTVPEYRWTRNGVPVTDWKSTGDFVITSLRKADAGSYACIASSEAGNILSGRITLVAKESAKIAVPPKTTWAQIENSAKLSCLATGDEPITYSWLKDGLRLLPTDELKSDKKDLVFQEIIEADEGEYACLAKNAHGSEKSEPAILNVFSANAIVEMDININNPRVKENCHLFNMTSVTETLDGLFDGKVAVVEFTQPDTMCNMTACSSDPCLNEGRCFVRGSGYVCQCPRGWGGKRCEIDANECEACVGDVCTASNGTCRNNGTCVNRKGSFSCTCLEPSRGKLCQFANKICNPKVCQAGETCYPKETETGYECLRNVQTVSMEYKLEESRLPFEDWMINDIARDIENAIITSGVSEVSQGVQGRRKRRDTGDNIDISLCSVRIEKVKPKGTTLELTIILVCKHSPNKTFICNAMLAEDKVKSCIGEGDKTIIEPETTEPPSIAPLSVTVIFIARDLNNEDVSAIEMINELEGENIKEKLKRDGMTVVELRARNPPTAGTTVPTVMSGGVIAGIIIAVVLLMLVAAVICFVILRTRKNKDRDFSIGGRAILAPKKHKRFERDISMKELKDAEIRGMKNKMFASLEEERHESSDVEDGGFMVKIPKSVSRTNIVDLDYMDELETADWFHGSISRSKAEDILGNEDTDGSFLVRAGLDQGEFYVSTRISEDDTKCHHVAVNRHDDSFVTVCGPESEAMKFTTFHELLEYLRATPTLIEGDDTELLLKDFVKKNSD